MNVRDYAVRIKPLRAALVSAIIAASMVEAADTVRTPTAATSTTPISAIESALTPLARARAELWALSATEWQRYEFLMSGVRGSISPANISPIEVLGIHANDQQERREYAERWAQLMHEDVERVLAFQRAYDEAIRRLYPNEQLIADGTAAAGTRVDSTLTIRDRILLFVRPNCPPCDAVLADALKQLDRIAGVDVYLSQVDTGDPSAVRTWAAAHGISPESVKRGRVTLNFEAETLAKLGHAAATLPVVMRRRGDNIGILSSATLR